jgi:hypothetical protein
VIVQRSGGVQGGFYDREVETFGRWWAADFELGSDEDEYG